MKNIIPLLLLLFIPFVYADDVAKVLFTKGEVTLFSSSGESKNVIKGTEVFSNDIIETSDHSFCILSFPEGSKLKIDKNSKVRIEKISFEVEKVQSDDTSLFLLAGKILLDISKKNDGDEKKVCFFVHFSSFFL